jgi:hypothetical protein
VHVYFHYARSQRCCLETKHFKCGITCVHLRHNVLRVCKDATLKIKVTKGTEFLAETDRGLMSLGTELASNNMVHGTHFFKMNSFNLNHSNSNIQHSKCCVFACVSSLPHFIVFLPLFPSSFFSLHPFFNIPVPYYLLIVISITAIMDYMCLITSNRKQFFRKQTYFHPQINPWRMCLFIFIPYAITKRPTACQRT